MSGNSSVGTAAVYEAGDQRNVKDSEEKEANRFHEGKENSHKAQDSKDERTIANKLAREEKRESEKDGPQDEEHALHLKDATAPAKAHGNKPSRGAEIDQELREEEAETIEKMNKKGKGDVPGKK